MRALIYIQVFLALVFVLPASGQNDTTENSYVVNDTLKEDLGLFIHDEVLDISLRFDITEYRNKKPKDEYLKAIFTYHFNDKDSINKEIRLKSRGEFRNEYCDFPPIRLNLKKTDVVKEELKDVEKMKLVTHCMSGNEEYILKEYLIYKLYNILTDTSFRVRLLRIKYINTHKKSKPIIAYGFLIEPLNLLGDRINPIPQLSCSNSERYKPSFSCRYFAICYLLFFIRFKITHKKTVLSIIENGFTVFQSCHAILR